MTEAASRLLTWPKLLDRSQLCAYLQISEGTLAKVCPVQPLDLGANVVRWNRSQIDAWADGLPGRLSRRMAEGQDAAPDVPAPEELPAEERRNTALDRARMRAQGKPCRRSRTSSGSSGQTAA